MLIFSPTRTKLLADKVLLGQWGQKQCEKFLKRKGLKKLTANFSCRSGEIDLIMADPDRSIVFVEVKTRATEDFAPARFAVTLAKKTKIIKTARCFLAAHKITDRPFRFDVVTIVLGRAARPQITHYISAFTP